MMAFCLFLLSPSITESNGMAAAVKGLSRQNHFAALIITKSWRGYYARRCMVDFGGAKWTRRLITFQKYCRAFLARCRVRKLGLVRLHWAAHTLQSFYYRWKYSRTKKLFSLAVMRKAVIKLQGCYRRRQARKLYLLVRTIRRNRLATRMQCFVRQRLAVIRSKRRKQLFNLVSRGELFSFEQDPGLYGDDIAYSAMCMFFTILRTIILQADFIRAYKVADQLLSYYYRVIDKVSIDDYETSVLLQWSVQMGVYISCVSYWSKYGPTRQLNLFILERAMGLLLHYGCDLKHLFPISTNPYTNDSIDSGIMYMRRYNVLYSLQDCFSAFYQLCHYKMISRLKLFDALILKADMLMLYTWFGTSYTALNVNATGLPTLKAVQIDRQYSHRSGLTLDSAASPIVHQSTALTSFQMVRKIWQLLLKAKSLLSQGSSDQYELKFRLEFYTSISTPISLESHMKETFRYYPIYLIPRPSAPNFRNLNIKNSSGLSVSCRIIIIRYGFLVCLYGRAETEYERTNTGGSFISSSRASMRIRRLSSNSNIQPGSSKAIPTKTLFSAESTLSEQDRESLELFAGQALGGSDMLRPYLIFTNEIEYLAETYSLYASQSKASRRFSSSSFSVSQIAHKRPKIDYRKLNSFLLETVQVNLFTPLYLSCPSNEKKDLESAWQISLPALDQRRLELLEKNDSRYSTLLIQRVYRGHLGRICFRKVKANYYIYRRKKWLSWKVMYKWRCLRRKWDCSAALIQSHYKGRLWRKFLSLMRTKILYIQCAARVFLAKMKVRREKDRRNGGPTVYDMIPAGKIVIVGDRKIYMKVHRCGNSYRLHGTDMVQSAEYHGQVFQDELASLIDEYNESSPSQSNQRSQSPGHSYGNQQKLRIWQYENVCAYILCHLALIPRIYATTNELLGSKRDTDLVFIVSNTLRGVFTNQPPVNVRSKKSESSLTRRIIGSKSLNNLNIPQVQTLLPPIKPPGQVHEHIQILETRRRLEAERLKVYYSYSSKKAKQEKKVPKKPTVNNAGLGGKSGKMSKSSADSASRNSEGTKK